MVRDALDQSQIKMEEEQNDNTNLPEEGMNFGSMNMDEFLDSIWDAELAEMLEEDQAQVQTEIETEAETGTPALNLTTYETTTNSTLLGGECSSLITNQSTIPAPICWKTSEEIWFEIQVNEQNERRHSCTSKNLRKPVRVPAPAPVQPQATNGDMTLEDFLVNEGVIPEQQPILLPNLQGLYPKGNNPLVGTGPPDFSPSWPRPILAYPPPATQFVMRETPSGVGSGIRPVGYQTPIVYAGGGYGAVGGLATTASPISSDGMGLETFEASGSGVSDKVAERKRRRMIKNRASASRSRARKQACTSELENEINNLKDENYVLKQRGEELEQTNQYMEEIIAAVRARMGAETGRKELNEMRRYSSCLADILI